MREIDGTANVWSYPLDGGSPKQMTRFDHGQIWSYDFLTDGGQIVLSYGESSADVVLISGFE